VSPQFVVWLDRDGTIVDDPGYLSDPDEVHLLPGAAEAIALLREAGGFVALVTNQSGIARGYMTRETVDRIHERMRAQLRDTDPSAELDALYLCPHLPPDKLPPGQAACDCRKPGPGMVLQALREHELAGLAGFVVGDKLSDLGLAQNVGARGVLLRSGDGREAEAKLPASGLRADHVCDDVLAAARWIVREAGAS